VTRIRKPCRSCPWRVDAETQYWDPAHFTQIYRTCQNDGAHVMMCHGSVKRPDGCGPDGRKLVCQGWVRVMGLDAIGVRIAALRGYISKEEIEDKKPRGIRLYKTFDDVLIANGIEIPGIRITRR
jgi:hypothetical protein